MAQLKPFPAPLDTGPIPEFVPKGRFETLRPRADCPHCQRDSSESSIVDAVYCMSLQDEARRFSRVEDHLHEIGLCRGVIFYRTERHPEGRMGTWYSHKAIAQECLARGHERVLMLEDDVIFSAPWKSITQRAERALARIPEDWRVFFLGHKPFRAYPIARDMLRVSSYLAHAYIANRPMLEWLAQAKPGDPTIPSDHPSIDTGFRNMVGMYALFPMVAKQLFIWPTFKSMHELKIILRNDRLPGEIVNFYLVRLLEMIAVLGAPFHLNFFRRKSVYEIYIVDTQIARDARLIRSAHAFDDRFYLQTYPDIYPCDPLRHYIWDGAHEGRRPNRWFNTAAYLQQHPELHRTKENPLAHFLRHSAP